ncbi:hypothetical protein Chor_007529, partial [Crotalus horridus]
RLHRALNNSFTEDKHQLKTKPVEKKSSPRNSQVSVWNTTSPGNCHRRKYVCSVEKPSEVMLKQLRHDTAFPALKRDSPGTTNGKAETLNAARTSVIQELSELEKQIEVIKQELQLAMSRKLELEEFQRTNRTVEL